MKFFGNLESKFSIVISLRETIKIDDVSTMNFSFSRNERISKEVYYYYFPAFLKENCGKGQYYDDKR